PDRYLISGPCLISGPWPVAPLPDTVVCKSRTASMPNKFLDRLSSSWGVSRRTLFQQGGLLAAAQALGGGLQRAASAAPLQLGNLYRSIGVRPVINARGTFTIITGSTTLPEVKRAMEEASRGFVNMDELMDGVSKRLA